MSFLSGLLRRRSRARSHALVCQEVVEMVTDYLEGALSPADRRRLQNHLADCLHCTEYLDQIRETIRLTGQVTRESLTPEMRTDLTDLYLRWRAEG